MGVSVSKQTKSDGHTTRLFCDPCKGENENEPAVAYCTVCNEYPCHSCRKAHTRLNVSKGHTLMEGGDMPNQRPTSDKGSMCPKHSDKPLEYYCKSDDRFCCSVCASIDHKQCMIQFIEDIGTDFHKSNEYIALEKASTDLIRLLQETKVTTTRNINDIETIHADFISDLQQFRSEINDILDWLENKATKEAQIVRDLDQQSVNSIATECDSMLSDIQRKSSELEKLNKYKQNRQLVICSKGAMNSINEYGKRVSKLSNQNKIRAFKFQPNEEICRFLLSLDNFGDMKERQNDEKAKVLFSTNNGSDDSIFTSHHSEATHVGNIEVQHSTDMNRCFITGGVIVDQTRLALVDRGNDSIKIADLDTNTITSSFNLTTAPFGITSFKQNQIVVTGNCSYTGKLVFLKVGPSLYKDKELDIDKHCRCIVYTEDTFFVTFYRPESSLKAIDTNGNVLKTFKLNTVAGHVFSDPWCVCLSLNQQTIFVSDWSSDTVTSLTLDGTVQHVYTADSLDSLKGPRGLVVDWNDSVIHMAAYWSHSIYQLSTDGSRRRVIRDNPEGMRYPYMMTYCKTRHMLYIGCEQNGRPVVSVYHLY